MLSAEIPFDTFRAIWNEIFFLTDKNRQVYALAKKLQPRYRVALLSNINILHFEYIKQQFPVFDAFDDVLTSFELDLSSLTRASMRKLWRSWVFRRRKSFILMTARN